MNKNIAFLNIILVIFFSCSRERASNITENTVVIWEEYVAARTAEMELRRVERETEERELARLREIERRKRAVGTVVPEEVIPQYTPFKIMAPIGSFGHIIITENNLTYWRILGFDEDSGYITEKYDIVLERVNNMLYVDFYYDGTFLCRNIAHGQKRFLVLYLHGDYLFLYNENNKIIQMGMSRETNIRSVTPYLTATSELWKGDTVYSVNNLTTINNLRPWVTEGSGVGEKITLTPSHSLRGRGFSSITISNGYVDFNRSYLYEYFNRVKKIRVSWGNPDEYIVFDLEDTPQFQRFVLHSEFQSEINFLEIEILEVYRGLRYDNTAMNIIIPWS